MKCKCGNNLFIIQVISCCDDCDQNPAYYDEQSTYDLKLIDEKELDRVGVEDNGECNMGTAYGPGCYMFVCKDCNDKTHLPIIDGC